jgi:hypothetical protein
VASDKDRMDDFIRSGGETPPLSFEALGKEDAETLGSQMRGRAFDIRIVRGIAKRCPWGKPQVIVCGPLRDGRPFPTTFWLTCPFLDRLCGRLESEGAVGALEVFLSGPEEVKDWEQYNELAVRYRLGLLSVAEREKMTREEPAMMENLETAGLGGIRVGSRPSVKCLHLQVAAWLGLGFHPAGAWLASRMERLECGGTWVPRCGKGVDA